MSSMKNLRFLGLFVVMLTMFSMSALATNKDYYSKITAKAVGEGKVYVSYKNQASSPTYAAESSAQSGADNQKEAPTHTYYLYAQTNNGSEFAGWFNNENCTGNALSTNIPYSVTITASENTASATYYALFKPVFKFSATAEKIYDHGTVTATVANSRIVGAKGDTEKSTTATFTATPNDDCTFVGWYYDEAHTQLASNSPTYKPTIKNNLSGSTANLTLYAWFKSNQTLTWTNPDVVNIVNGTTETGAAAATAKSADTGTDTGLTVTYESTHPEIATVNTSGDVTGVSASATAVTITATQAGNDEYNPVSATRQFYVVNKIEATFTPSGFSVSDLITLYVDATPTITLTGVDTDFTCISSNDEVVSLVKSGNVITLTAHKVGTADVTLTQPNNTTHSAVSTTYHFTVEKVPNTLSVSHALNAQVDGTIAVTFADQNNTATPIIGTITDQSLSSTVNEGTDVITYANGTITAKNAGTAKITFTQAETDKYTAFTSSTYEITVTKISNPITITLAGGSATNIKLKYGAKATLTYSSAHSDKVISVDHVEGNYTTYSNGTITAGNSAGTDIYEIRQAETYKYEAGNASFVIRVNDSDEAPGYVYAGWINGDVKTLHTIDSTGELILNGPGALLTFEAKKQTSISVSEFHVMYYSEKDNEWHEFQDGDVKLTTSYVTYPFPVPDGATKIKLEARMNATGTKDIKNIYVTRKTYVEASPKAKSFGIVYTDANPKRTETFTIDYSSVNGGNINISSNNPHFVPNKSQIDVDVNKKDPTDTYICGVNGTESFEVTYNPDPNQLGEESAVITISDLFNSKQITLTATAAKHDNTLAVIGTQNLMVDDVVSNVYSSKNSNATLNYTLSREGVITYDPSTNKITAVGAGTTTLTFTQAANDYYLETSKSVIVNVSKYDQTISWDKDITDLTLEYGDVLTTNTATASTGMTVTYSSSNTDVLTVDPTTGRLEAVGGGSSVITATQAGTYKISAVSITRRFTVFKREEATVTTSLSESGTNSFPIGNPAITIRANATLTEGSFTVTGNSEGYVSYSFAENTNTLTISALKEGGPITVRLTRPQDELYYAIDKSYTIQVVKPVLVLDPTKAPAINYTEYSSVTYSGSLKAGYSTIALPFDIDVETLVAGRTEGYDSDVDWVAQLSIVTYNAKDGYSLYFQKSNQIVANEPYILHLGTAVNSPVFTNVSVVAAEEGTQNATKGVGASQWTLHANYDPTFVMDGYYGVVGEKIKKGTTGSTLKAYHAYIIYNGAAPGEVKAAYLEEDEADAILELLNAEATEPENIYDLQGRQLPRAGKGINIIRNADGTVRKVLSPNR